MRRISKFRVHDLVRDKIYSALDREIAMDLLGFSDKSQIYDAAIRNRLVANRYRVALVTDELEIDKAKLPDTLLKEWDNMRKAAQLVKDGKAKIVYRHGKYELVMRETV